MLYARKLVGDVTYRHQQESRGRRLRGQVLHSPPLVCISICVSDSPKVGVLLFTLNVKYLNACILWKGLLLGRRFSFIWKLFFHVLTLPLVF